MVSSEQTSVDRTRLDRTELAAGKARNTTTRIKVNLKKTLGQNQYARIQMAPILIFFGSETFKIKRINSENSYPGFYLKNVH